MRKRIRLIAVAALALLAGAASAGSGPLFPGRVIGTLYVAGKPAGGQHVRLWQDSLRGLQVTTTKSGAFGFIAGVGDHYVAGVRHGKLCGRRSVRIVSRVSTRIKINC